MSRLYVSSNATEVIKQLSDELAAYQKNLTETVFKALTRIEAAVVENIRSKSGLKVRSGALLNSIGRSKTVYEDSKGLIVGELGPEGIPYAAIHEFGGTTKPHIIRARNAQALHFMGSNGNDVFAKFVNHPGSKIPARPYLRPALASTKDSILKDFGLFIKASFKEVK